MKRAIVLSVLFLILCLPAVFSLSYNETGFNQFAQGRGSFNTERDVLTEIDPTSKSLTDPRLTPIVSDLDGDGTNEIIVLSGDTVFVYQGKTLTTVASYDYGTAQLVGQMSAFDIDGDSEREIIFVGEESETIYVLNFTDGTLQSQNQISLTALDHGNAGANSGETMFSCREANDCLLVYSVTASGRTSVGPILYATTFNTTSVINTLTVDSSTTTISTNACLPKIRHIEMSDLTNDGDQEYIISWMYFVGAGSNLDRYRVSAIDVTATVPTKVWQYEDDASWFTHGGSAHCNNNVGKYFSPPISFNLEDDTPTEREVMFARMTSSSEYDIIDLKADGTELDQHPAGPDSGEGQLVSNVFRANAIPNSQEDDVCVLSYESSTQELNMICGSKSRTSGAFESFEYTVSTASIIPNFNVTQDYLNYHIISHSAQHSNSQTDGVDLTEVVNAYGIYTADFDSCDILANCDMALEFPNVCLDSVLLSVDVQNLGSDDLICMTDNQITYIDDLLSNAPAEITSLAYDPCPTDSILKVNNTWKVTVQVTDGDQGTITADNVNTRVTMYRGTLNEYSQNVTGLSSGASQTFFLPLNLTGNNFELFIEAWDDGLPSNIDTNTQTFTVGDNGLEPGLGQSCTFDFAEIETTASLTAQVNATLLTTKGDNSVTGIFSLVNQLTGLGGFALVIVILLIVSIGLLLGGTVAGYDMKNNLPLMLAFIFMVDMAILVLSTILGLIGIGGVVVILLIIVGGLSISISKMFQGGTA